MVRAWTREVRYPGPGHLEVANLAFDRGHDGLRIDLERCRSQISVEEVMQVLIGRDSSHDLSSRSVGQEPARVVMHNARRRAPATKRTRAVGDTPGSGTTPVETWVIPRFRRDRVHRACDGQIVAEHDRVTTLFRSPASDPRTPDIVRSESPRDGPRVVREVVLGEQVHDNAAPSASPTVASTSQPSAANSLRRSQGTSSCGNTPWPTPGVVPRAPPRWAQLNQQFSIFQGPPTYRLVGRFLDRRPCSTTRVRQDRAVPVRHGGGAGLMTVRQVPATAARESNP